MPELQEILTTLCKSKGFVIFRSLKEPKTWIELEKIAKGDKSSISRRIDEFIKLGLVRPTLVENSPKGTKVYTLTHLGKIILAKLEELENLLANPPPTLKMSPEEVIDYLNSLPEEEKNKLLVRKSVKEEEIL